MKFVVGENGKNREKNLPRPCFVHHETHMEGPRHELGTPAVGGKRLTACATRLNQQIDHQKCIVISHLKSTTYTINLSQIRTLSIKCEKVCAVCLYLSL